MPNIGAYPSEEHASSLSQILEQANTVRRLTVTEYERLQGLPDGWTNVPWNNHPARDSERIKAIGNGMAQPCADFILRQLVFYHSQISP